MHTMRHKQNSKQSGGTGFGHKIELNLAEEYAGWASWVAYIFAFAYVCIHLHLYLSQSLGYMSPHCDHLRKV